MQPTTAPRWILPALVLFGLVLKLAWAGHNELAHDEPFTVYWAQRSLAELVAMLRTENNPPLYFLLMKAWAPLAGTEVALWRWPSAVFSALTAWPLFLLARRLSGTGTAVVAVLLFTFNQHLYGFAHEVRAYGLFILLTTAGMWQTARLVDDAPGARRWLLLLNTALVYTHFFGWLAVGLQALCVWGVPAWRTARRHWNTGALLLLVIYLPYAGLLYLRATESIGQGTWLPPPTPEEVYNMLWRWSNAPVLAVAFLLPIIALVARRSGRDARTAVLLIWTFVPLLGMYVISMAVPIYLDRYLSYAAPGFLLLVAHALATLPRRAAPVAAGAAVLGMAFTFAPWQGSGLHPSRAVAQVQQWLQEDPGARVLVVPPWYRLAFRWAEDPQAFGSEAPLSMYDPVLHAGEGDPPATTVVVDAVAQAEEHRALLRTAGEGHVRHDSVEVYHKVWVHRYHRWNR